MGLLQSALGLLQSPADYRRPPPMILINGLAEQAESWFSNNRYWSQYFDVKVPEYLVYDGRAIHRRIEVGEPVDVPFLTNQFELFLDNFVQRPPYHLVASSLGCQIAVEYAVRQPQSVGRMVLLCPSGMGGEEKLPVAEGMRSNNFEALVGSVFYNRKYVHPQMVRHFEKQFANKLWRKGLLRVVRGTSEHCVREKLSQIHCPCLVVCGQEDRIVDPQQALEAIRGLVNYRFVMLPRCGHAPQIERATLINRLVRDFLWHSEPLSQEQLSKTVSARPSYA